MTLAVGDRIFGYREDYYLLSGGNLIIQPNGDAAAQMVLAENIDSLGVTFRNATGGATTLWKDMRSASFAGAGAHHQTRSQAPASRLPEDLPAHERHSPQPDLNGGSHANDPNPCMPRRASSSP